MSISLIKSLTVPKVSQDGAANVYSERFQNPRLAIYPAFNGQDLVGRPVNHNSFMTLTGGPSHPMARIAIENQLRPSYFVYLNGSGLDGDDAAVVPSLGGYDTAGVMRDQAFGLNGTFQVPVVDASAGYEVMEENERARLNAALRRKYDSLRFANMQH